MQTLNRSPYITNLVPQTSVTLESAGLISGKLVRTTITLGEENTGIVFVLPDAIRIHAKAFSVVDARRGVTLWDPTSQLTLSIVEHFLAAVALVGITDLEVHLHAPEGGVPCELPLLEGSSLPWFDALVETFGWQEQVPVYKVVRPFFFQVNEKIHLYALPSEYLRLGYVLDYAHKDLRHQWAYWDFKDRSQAEARALLQARTFGETAELPAMLEQGLAKGVSLENTLGLNEDNETYTTPLRLKNEPLFHKMLDLLGDFYLSEIPLAQVQGTFVAFYAGHSSHLAFANALREEDMVICR
ncbi:MAG: UDP-3-O-acyl-N-acetylglucosamine deacetylase [Vampirovibrionales bacterium]|jgi:UDP-3-O-[3-hydroxymyristoyl] N-acetylglucosamine deacetylase|nr:UDP-3-O-acyl-N-acetylglucosamine deacetylase [Vampirovibrionales bacterium]